MFSSGNVQCQQVEEAPNMHQAQVAFLNLENKSSKDVDIHYNK